MAELTRAYICKQCGADYVAAAKGKHLYCSRPCQQRHWLENRGELVIPIEKPCKVCGAVKPIAAFSPAPQCRDGYRDQCLACRAAYEKENWKHTGHRPSRTYEYKRGERFKRKYGITLADYDQMLIEQDGRCAICRSDNAGWNRAQVWAVDHDHVTNKVRALLCHHCNSMLGQARESPLILLSAIAYLERFVTRDSVSTAPGLGTVWE